VWRVRQAKWRVRLATGCGVPQVLFDA